MFKTIGIRTLLMACGVVTLITQHPLASQAAAGAVNVINPKMTLNVQEGTTGKLLFGLKNTTGHSVTLFGFPTFRQIEDPSDPKGDSLKDTFFYSVISSWNSIQGQKLETNKTIPVELAIMTHKADMPADRPPDSQLWDFKSEKFFVDGFPSALMWEAKVNVYDPVPETSSLVLVGVCVLSVCGFGWLRRRRIPYEA
jgi:hypothetical protein